MVAMFSRCQTEDDVYENLFSVQSSSQRGPKGRVIICHNGGDDGFGEWICSKDSGSHCQHVGYARDHLQKLLSTDPDARDGGNNQHSVEDEGISELVIAFTPGSYCTYTCFLAPNVRRAGQGDVSISHLPIAPPVWASLPTNTLQYPRPGPFLLLPLSLIQLDADAACLCGAVQQPMLATVEKSCIIFTLTESCTGNIQLQPCSRCDGVRRRTVGPDCRGLGLFNYNNRILITHELLDEYTSAYTSSETPFAAWVSTVCRRYMARGSAEKFLTEEMFRAIWFSYIRLQIFENDMQCTSCGPTPETTIWDGVTLAFHRKHLSSSLQPPTISDVGSVTRTSKALNQQQVIPDAGIRKLVIKVVTGVSLHLPTAVDLQQSQSQSQSEATAKALKELQARLDAIPLTLAALSGLDSSLGVLFERYWGLAAVRGRHKAPPVYRRLFVQVCQ